MRVVASDMVISGVGAAGTRSRWVPRREQNEITFFVEFVNKPTDNSAERCFGSAAGAQSAL
jgi:hypothetical protein